jgi:DeoR/GlpR family transcriptional regulator of sugar metabolism
MAVCPLSRVHTLITDNKAPENLLDLVRRAGVNVVVVREEGDSISSAA